MNYLSPSDPLYGNFSSMGNWGNSTGVPNPSQYFSNMGGLMQGPGIPMGPASSGFADQISDWWQNSPIAGGIDPKTGMRTMGKLDYGLMGAQTLLSALQGWQANKMAKKQLSESKRQFDQNFNAQAGLINSQLSDRQNNRIASADNMAAFTGTRPNYQDTASYMAQYGVKRS